MHFSAAALLAVALTLLLSPCSGQIRQQFDLKYEECSDGKEYNDCGCPTTCSNYIEYLEIGCKDCTPGCYCPEGYVEYKGKCIPPEECPELDPPYIPPTPSESYPTFPPPEPYPVYPYPSNQYPYDPYEPYDPYDPYPFQYCELNEDEYGRPYYGPYDRYLSKNSYPPRVPNGYPAPPTGYPPRPYPTAPPPYPTHLPPGYPTTAPPYPTRPPLGYRPPPPPYRPYPYPVPTLTLPPPETYTVNLTQIRNKRQTLTLPTCITNNECYQQPGKLVQRCKLNTH